MGSCHHARTFKKYNGRYFLEEILLDDDCKIILGNYRNLFVFISSDIVIHLGDDVIFIEFGLYVQLQGKVSNSWV